MHLVLSFVLLFVASAAFIALGLLMVCWPATYMRWVERSKVADYAPWVARKWDLNHVWRIKILGIEFALFGVTACILTIWVCWFQ